MGNEDKVIFQEESVKPPQFEERVSFQAKLVNLIMKASKGRIKTEQQAIYVILGLVAMIFIISFVLLKGGSEEELYAPPAEEFYSAE